MHLFGVKNSGEFIEYTEHDFKGEHREQTLESWLESNPDSIIEDGTLLIIGRQVSTNLGSFIDLLALDRSGSTVVLELKRARTPREAISQALEYASFVETLDYEQLEQILRVYTGNEGENLSEYHRAFFKLDEGEAVSFNKDQRIVVVGSNVTPEIRQTAMFLRRKGLRVTCVEFKYFQTGSGETLLSSDIVVGREPLKTKSIDTVTLPRIDKKKFLESLDQTGHPFFEAVLGLSESYNLPIHWGSKGFSLNVDIKGKHVALCYGYPPESVFKQSLYTAFADIKRKIEGGTDLVMSFRDKFRRTGIFIPAGSEVKLVIQQILTEKQIAEITKLLVDLASSVKELGLAETDKAR